MLMVYLIAFVLVASCSNLAFSDTSCTVSFPPTQFVGYSTKGVATPQVLWWYWLSAYQHPHFPVCHGAAGGVPAVQHPEEGSHLQWVCRNGQQWQVWGVPIAAVVDTILRNVPVTKHYFL